MNPGSEVVRDAQRVYARNLEVPSGGGVGTARAIAHAYSVFATGGRELGLRRRDPARAGRAGDPVGQRVLRRLHESRRRPVLARLHEVEFRLAVRQRALVRSPGAGGSLGFADPEAGIGYAYVTSQMGGSLRGDPRDVALRDALYEAIAAR